MPPVLWPAPGSLVFGFWRLPGVCAGLVASPLRLRFLGFGVFSGCGALFVANPLGLRFLVFAVFPMCGAVPGAKPLGPRFLGFGVFPACMRRVCQTPAPVVFGFWRLLGVDAVLVASPWA